jgi:hypothetical protein
MDIYNKINYMSKIIRLTESDMIRLVKRVITEQSEKEDFHKKLEEVLNYAGDRSESVYMALYNKLNDWMETDKDEQQFQNDTV